MKTSNQRGLSILSMVLSLAVICVLIMVSVTIIKKRMGAATGQGDKATIADTKSMASDMACGQAIQNIAGMVAVYQSNSGNYPSSMSDLSEQNPDLAQLLGNTDLWVENGAPTLETSDSGFKVTGYCTSGKQYTYSSEGGSVTATPF